MATKKVAKDEQIGFHKGSISVLTRERDELLKIVSICEQLMQMHLKQLEELGVDLSELQPAEEKSSKKPAKKKKIPIEHLI